MWKAECSPSLHLQFKICIKIEINQTNNSNKFNQNQTQTNKYIIMKSDFKVCHIFY